MTAFPADRRHLETHRGHLIEVTDLERPLVSADLIRATTGSGTRAEVRRNLDGIEGRASRASSTARWARHPAGARRVRRDGRGRLIPGRRPGRTMPGVTTAASAPLSAGLAALLDDVAVLARAAAASVDDVAAGASRASVKAAGVIVDDAAVTPRYVQGFRPERELPMIRRIAVGSLRNKLLFILPAALLLSEFVPWLLTPILMIGGAYLCYEGAEKLWEYVSPHAPHEETPVSEQGPEHEDALVGSAIRTDFILSAEIMVISLNEVADEPFVSRALILVLVAFAITAVRLRRRRADREDGRRRPAAGAGAQRCVGASFGRGLVRAMPVVLSVLSKVGIAAMLWVGGHILLVGLDDLGLSAPYDEVHHLEEDVEDALGGVGAWLTNTGASAVLGLIVGAIIVAVMHLRGRDHAPEG